ncbi:MAG: N-acetylneuraminate synthase [Solirubrobacterales bacterium]
MGQKRTIIIAEAGVNHNGSVELAEQMVDRAAEAGADWVKFQTFRADQLVTRAAPKAQYQVENSQSQETQFEMLSRLELGSAAHQHLFDYCRRRGIGFLSSPFEEESLNMLTRTVGVEMLKLASGEITNGLLMLAAARTGLPIILSTGMSTLKEIEQALGVLAFGYLQRNELPSLPRFAEAFHSPAGKQVLREQVILLHCTSEYPAPYSDVNLRAMDTLTQAFGLRVGLSDHTAGVAIAIAAAARGAAVIEKHFTLDRNMPGPDQKASLNPEELRLMVQSIRQVEAAMGSGEKVAQPAEASNKAIVRKSLVALQPIGRSELFTEANLGMKRPGSGINPMRYWEYLGREAQRNYETDELIEE